MMDDKEKVYLKELVIKYKLTEVNGEQKIIGERADNSKVVAKLFADLQNEIKEKFITINLDVKCKILCFEVVALGSLNRVFIKPKDILRSSIITNAEGFIAVHNHPSGDPTPSERDILFTQKLQRYCSDLEIHFYDHIIIGANRYFSFLDEGLM